jgi:UDP-glucuronate decarboxylase
MPGGARHYQYNPIKTIKTSVDRRDQHAGDGQARTGAKVLQASTSEVYGDPDVHPQPGVVSRQREPDRTPGLLRRGQARAETLFFDYHRQNRVNIRVVRIFNTYGPRMHPYDGRVVSNFIRQAIAGEDITIFGDGEQTRSFCYVDDLVEGIMKMMNGPDDFHGPVNLGNPGEFTIKQLAEMVIDLTESSSQLVYRPLPQDDPMQRKPIIDLAREKLDWEPQVPLREGLARTIDYFKKIDLSQFRAPTPNF